jgi:hypothetical protein
MVVLLACSAKFGVEDDDDVIQARFAGTEE